MRVEVAGRLVGEQHGRLGHQGSGHRDALLLAAGQLGRAVRAALVEADAAITASTQGRSSLRPAIESGSVMFSSAVSVGTRLKAWNTKPMCLRRSSVSSLVAHRRDVLAADLDCGPR